MLQRVGKKLGQGAFGEVIQACREDTGEQVAVKQIPIRVDDDRHQEKIMVRCFWLSSNHARRPPLTPLCICSGRSAY